MKKRRIILCIGSNVENAPEILASALLWLRKILFNLKSSSFYQTPAVGARQSDLFYTNCVCEGEFEDSIEKLNILLKDYERACGRTDALKTEGIVPIDIDIVIDDRQIVREWDFRQVFFQKGYRQLYS